MNTPSAFQSPDRRPRRSSAVTLVLLGAVGIGGIAAWDAWQRSQPGSGLFASWTTRSVSVDQSYSNNDFLPGIGYYHAPYHAWYPRPYNQHDPARGYYGGGMWSAVPLAFALSRSQPSASAVASANAVLARQQEEERNRPATGSFGSRYRSMRWGRGSSLFSGSPGSSGSGSSGYSSPSNSSHPSGSSIHRGGFGSSGHSFGSGS